MICMGRYRIVKYEVGLEPKLSDYLRHTALSLDKSGGVCKIELQQPNRAKLSKDSDAKL